MDVIKGTAVIGIGIPSVDYILELDAMPKANGFADFADESWQGGGRVPTALAALGRLGTCGALIGTVGGDAYGAFCIRDLERHGVDTSRVLVDPSAATRHSVCLAVTGTGERTILRGRGAVGPIDPARIDQSALGGARVLHLSDMGPAAQKAAGLMREAGGKVVVDADEYDAAMEEHLGLIDVFIAAEHFFDCAARGGVRAVLEDVRARGPEVAVITLGAKGCAVRSAEGYFELPSHQVPVRDTTGAGDVFHGAYIHGMITGLPPVECARLAQAVAAIKCTRLGGRAGIPDEATARLFMETGAIDGRALDERAAHYHTAFGA